MKLLRSLKKAKFLFLIVLIVFAFFYKSVIFGAIPFPGDLLVAHQEPYKSYSYLGYNPGSFPHKAQGPDVIKQLIPWKYFVVESFKSGSIPFWNPHNFSGNPLLANFQSGVFYPGNLIFLLFDFRFAWTIYIMIAPLFAAAFTYLFLRRLNLTATSALLGAISFSFCLYMSVWMEYGNISHTLLWLPLSLYFADKLLDKFEKRIIIGLVITLSLALLAGYIQGVFYLYAVVFAYFFYKGISGKKTSFGKSLYFLLLLSFPIFLTAFQIFPTLELFANSSRGNYSLDDIGKLLNPIWYLITVIVPDFFGNSATRNYWFDGTYIERVSYFGVIPFILALFALVVARARTEVRIFGFIFLATLFISTDFFITKFIYSIPIPVISTTVPTRILSIFAFSGSMLAAFGFEYLIYKKHKAAASRLLMTVFVFILIIFAALFLYPILGKNLELAQNLGISRRNMIIPMFIIIVFSCLAFLYNSRFSLFDRYKKNILIFSIIAITSFDLFYYFSKITPFSPKEFFYPDTPINVFLKENSGVNRFWGYDAAHIDSNFQTLDATFSPEGNDPLHIKNYTELIESSKNGAIPEYLPRPDANIAPGTGTDDLKLNPYRQKALNILGVKYVLNKNEGIGGTWNPDTLTFPESTYRFIWQDSPWQVYENLEVSPRFFVTNKYAIVSSSTLAIDTLFGEEFNEREEIVLYEDPKLNSIGSELVSDTKLVKYLPNEVVLKAFSSADGLIYLSDAYYPGWNAYVNGTPTKIYKANHAFRAVPIQIGENEVVFKYQPKSFYYGVYIAGVAFLVFLAAVLIIKKK